MKTIFKVSTGKVFIVIFLGLITLTSYFIIFNYINCINQAKSENLSRLSAIGKTLTVGINSDELEHLLVDYPSKNTIKTNEESEVYRSLHLKLKDCHDKNDLPSPIYTIHRNHHTGAFEHGITSSETPYYRHQYSDPPEELQKLYYHGGEIEKYKTASGEYLSVICPIRNNNNLVIGALELDLPFGQFISEARSDLLRNSLISVGIYMVIGLLMFQLVSKVLKIEQKQKAIDQDRKNVMDYKQQEINSSISYARRIQQALWPDNAKIRSEFSDFFSINLPKDTVSGDFYWHHKINGTDEFLVIHADCTGHGVPGAMMSVLGNTIFNEIVVNYGVTEPSQILNLANKKLIRLLQQEKEENLDDGMAVSIALVNKKQMILKYAGANQNSIIIRNGQLIDLEGDKYPVGGAHYNPKRGYTSKTVLLEENDSLYLFSDGFKDQFGGPNNKKFLSSNFYKMIIENSRKSMEIQKTVILDRFKSWRGEFEQIDDVSLLGIKI